MYALEDLEKQQVGLRLPKYLISEIDALTEEYSLNRSEIIIESIRVFLKRQKEEEFYRSFADGAKELKEVIDGKKEAKPLNELLDELGD